MIAQWEKECISLCILPVAWVQFPAMARVMIAQWENECTALSVLSVALVRIAEWENE